MASIDKFQHHKKAFLLAFADCGSVTEAAERVKIDRTTHYVWVRDGEYAEAFKEAQDRAARMLEDEAVKRAKSGSDTLLIFLLKCRNRAVFGDRQEITGADGKPLIALGQIDALLNGNGNPDK